MNTIHERLIQTAKECAEAYCKLAETERDKAEGQDDDIAEAYYGNADQYKQDAHDVEALIAEASKKCRWIYRDYDCFYDTACGQGFFFDIGTAKENNVNYCHYCGLEVEAIEAKEDEE